MQTSPADMREAGPGADDEAARTVPASHPVTDAAEDSPGPGPVDPPLTVWTIGHSTRPIDEFIALLRAEEIALLADVRSHPGSRKYPQFNRGPLAASLQEAGIAYEHLPDLGGRRKTRPDSPNTAWRNASFRGYADYMQTDAYRAGIGRLLDAARARRTAIMCSEAVWWRCHRSIIADGLKSRGVRVLHIMGGGTVKEHPYTSAARIVGGRLSYASELFDPAGEDAGDGNG